MSDKPSRSLWAEFSVSLFTSTAIAVGFAVVTMLAAVWCVAAGLVVGIGGFLIMDALT